MNNQLTLLIFLKDRFEFTKRVVQYLAAIKYPFSVTFADGSIGDEAENYFKLLKNDDFSYQYIRFPKDETLSNYYQKSLLAIKTVKTPYVMLADNDDFPIVEGQLEAIDFLNNNAEYIGCNGRVGGLVVHPHAQNPYGDHIFYLPRYCNTMDKNVLVNQSTGRERILSYLTNFYSIFYSVYRTQNLAHTFKEMKELNFSDLGIAELFFSYTQLAQGKVHTIDSLTYIRQKGSSQAAVLQKDWFHRLFYSNWLSDLKISIQYVSEFISQKEGMNQQEIYDLLYGDFLARFRNRFVPNEFYFYKNPHLFFNKRYLKALMLHKIFKISAMVGEKMGFYSLLPFTQKTNLTKIREIICKVSVGR